MKKKSVWLMTLLMTALLTGCASDTTMVQVPEETVQTPEEAPASEEEQEPVSVTIYYSNMQADGFAQKEVEIEEEKGQRGDERKESRKKRWE